MHRVCPEDAGVSGTGAGQGGNKPRARKGVPFEYRGVGHHFALFATIRHFNAKEKDEVQVCKCCGD